MNTHQEDDHASAVSSASAFKMINVPPGYSLIISGDIEYSIERIIGEGKRKEPSTKNAKVKTPSKKFKSKDAIAAETDQTTQDSAVSSDHQRGLTAKGGFEFRKWYAKRRVFFKDVAEILAKFREHPTLEFDGAVVKTFFLYKVERQINRELLGDKNKMFFYECVHRHENKQCPILLCNQLVEADFTENEQQFKGSLVHKMVCGHLMHRKCYDAGVEKGLRNCPKCKCVIVQVEVCDGHTTDDGFYIKLKYGQDDYRWKPLRECDPVEMSAFVAYMDSFEKSGIVFYFKSVKQIANKEDESSKRADHKSQGAGQNEQHKQEPKIKEEFLFF
jgi:hypothetical protein